MWIYTAGRQARAQARSVARDTRSAAKQPLQCPVLPTPASGPALTVFFFRPQAGIAPGRGFLASMKTLDPYENFLSLLYMPKLFVQLHVVEVEYASNVAQCTRQKDGVQILHHVVKYLQNLLDSGLYMCKLTPEWEAVYALLEHESRGGIAADGARATEDPATKVCLRRRTHRTCALNPF